PDVDPTCGVDKLGGDTQPASRVACTAFEHITDIETARGFTDIDGRVPESKAVPTRGDRTPLLARKAGYHIRGHSVGQRLPGYITAEILKWQHGDRGIARRPIGGGRGLSFRRRQTFRCTGGAVRRPRTVQHAD